MMKNILILLLTTFILGCSNKAPDYVIPNDDMIDILVEIHIADGLLTINNVRKNLARNDSTNIYNTILSNYNYTRKDFDTSLYYYSKNIDEYDLMYNEVLNRLIEMESKIKENREVKIEKY